MSKARKRPVATSHDTRTAVPAAKGSKGARLAKPAKPAKPAKKPVLLTGGNPQIAKGDGEAPVQAYIAAMPGWKRDVGRRLDALVTRTGPQVRKAVRWNSPFYGIDGQGWFLGFHVFTRYVKVTFLRGTALRPVPPGESKNKETRYLDIYENDTLDEKQLAAWIEQAAAIPGWDGGSPRQHGGVPNAPRGNNMKKVASQAAPASERISKRIAELGDWRGKTLARVRKLITEADPEVVEEWKWMGTPVWSHDGIICTGESYKNVVKLTFARGASLDDPAHLFNASLEGNVRRAIDIHEGDKITEPAFKALIRAAVALNRSRKAKPAKRTKR